MEGQLSTRRLAGASVALAATAIVACSLSALTSGEGDAGVDAGTADSAVVPDAAADTDLARDSGALEAGDGMAADSASGDGHCGTTVIVAGSPDASVTYFATSISGGAWSAPLVASMPMTTMPSIVATPTGFAALFASANSQLMLASYSNATQKWSAPSSPNMAFTSLSGSSLALLDGGLCAVTRGLNSNYYFLSQGTPWTFAAIGMTSGPVGPTVANLGGSLVAALDLGGTGDTLNDETFVAGLGTWSAGNLSQALGGGAAPRIVALSSNSLGADACIVYQDPSHQLNAIIRVTGAWTSAMGLGALLSNGGTTNVDFATAALPGGGVGLVYLPASPPTASPQVALFTPNTASQPLKPTLMATLAPGTALQATPTIAAGVCGDKAIVAYGTGAAAEVVHFSGSGGSKTVAAIGTGVITFAAVATGP
jgi:hypothetical protein